MNQRRASCTCGTCGTVSVSTIGLRETAIRSNSKIILLHANSNLPVRIRPPLTTVSSTYPFLLSTVVSSGLWWAPNADCQRNPQRSFCKLWLLMSILSLMMAARISIPKGATRASRTILSNVRGYIFHPSTLICTCACAEVEKGYDISLLISLGKQWSARSSRGIHKHCEMSLSLKVISSRSVVQGQPMSMIVANGKKTTILCRYLKRMWRSCSGTTPVRSTRSRPVLRLWFRFH
ncbi:hypothetical protein BC827DRAFT_133181 [Russula dissimulans]|nr:hypothetical protein BC827DRAFT_133181 [Russula dissimulans]